MNAASGTATRQTENTGDGPERQLNTPAR